jgi:hypothetical protein
VGRAAVPAIVPVVEATCRSLAFMAGTAARPTIKKLFRHHTGSENGNKSEVPILRLEIQATSAARLSRADFAQDVGQYAAVLDVFHLFGGIDAGYDLEFADLAILLGAHR